MWGYGGVTFGKPSINNGLESLNAVIKQKYTLPNKLHLSTFLPKMESMWFDWSEASISSPFVALTDISSDIELNACNWSLNVNRSEIWNWFNNDYVVPSSTTIMTIQFGWICINQVNRLHLTIMQHGNHHADWYYHLYSVYTQLTSKKTDANNLLD